MDLLVKLQCTTTPNQWNPPVGQLVDPLVGVENMYSKLDQATIAELKWVARLHHVSRSYLKRVVSQDAKDFVPLDHIPGNVLREFKDLLLNIPHECIWCLPPNQHYFKHRHAPQYESHREACSHWVHTHFLWHYPKPTGANILNQFPEQLSCFCSSECHHGRSHLPVHIYQHGVTAHLLLSYIQDHPSPHLHWAQDLICHSVHRYHGVLFIVLLFQLLLDKKFN